MEKASTGEFMSPFKCAAVLSSIAAGLLFAACSQKPQEPADPFAHPHESVGYVEGTAKIISLDKAMGHAVLESRWQTGPGLLACSKTDFAQGGVITSDNPVSPGVAQYQPPLAQAQNFDAVPGDTVAFVGLKTGNDILLRGIKVIAHPK